MPNPILPRRSFTANAVPVPSTDISAAGELLINWADKVAYTKDSAGNLITAPLGGGGGGGGSGSATLVYAATAAAFPATGSTSNLFIATETQQVFRWDSSGVYVECGPPAGGSGGGGPRAASRR